jgi:lactoylglutathione lyase
MKTTGFTHVSINAHDLDESICFYQELFGMEEVPAPDFPFPVRWLRAGDLQLHLVESDETAPGAHHFALEVDDFEAAYQKAQELDIRYESGYFSYMYQLPDGAVQLYVRDPSENMVEINWPDITTLDRSVVTEEIHEVAAETEEAAKATLYLPRQG